MKGNPAVLAGLQEAINLEESLALQYALDARNLKRYGLSISRGMKMLARQCRGYATELVDALLFFDGGEPSIVCEEAATHPTVSTIQADALVAEQNIVARYAELCKEAFAAGEMDVFHLYQHLTKWHRRGGNGNEGHLAWLQKQNWQLLEFGEKEYEEVKA